MQKTEKGKYGLKYGLKTLLEYTELWIQNIMFCLMDCPEVACYVEGDFSNILQLHVKPMKARVMLKCKILCDPYSNLNPKTLSTRNNINFWSQ